MTALRVENLKIVYGSRTIVDHFDVEISRGHLAALLGPSGTGKTSVLKAISGLIKPAAGRIWINGERADGLPAEKRQAVMVFQQPLLFPFLNVARNIGFGLKMTGIAKKERDRRIDHILSLTRLDGLALRKIDQLSGGQQQRVSLARALVLNPAVLLLDEPLSSLDAGLRQQMRRLIQEIQEETGITTLFVTHDQAEALTMARQVTLLLNGRLRQTGSPQDLFYRPVDRAAARFFGGENFISGHIKKGVFHSGFGSFCPANITQKNADAVTATIRPEAIALSGEPVYPLKGQITDIRFEGSTHRIQIDVNRTSLIALTTQTGFAPDQPVWLNLPDERLWLLKTP